MGSSTHVTSQRYDGIIVQSSLKGIPITRGWGTAQVGCNLVDYLDFTSKKVSNGKGGGAQPDYDYYATLVLAIAVGPIVGIRTIYKDSAYYVAQSGGSKEVNGTTITYSSKTPLQAAGLSQLFLGSIWQAPWSYLTSNHPGDALGYSGIAYVAAENYNLNTAATSPNFNFEVQFPVRATIEGVVQDDANPADILNDLLPDVPRWPTGGIASLATLETYCYAQGLLLSPVANSGRQASDLITEIMTCANSDCFVSEGLFQVVPMGDTAITANGVTYTPNLTPIYSLTWDDILPNSDGEDPIQWDLKPTDQCYNYLTVGYLDRTQQYSADSVPAVDQASYDQFGKCQQDATSYESICLASVAATVAQLLVQRSANVRRTAKLTVSELYGLLDPMDLIEVPSPNGTPILVRITETAEKEDGSIELTVEEMLIGAAHAPTYTRANALGIPANFAIDPGDSVAPTIINPPLSLTGGQNEVWLATAGGPNWGGCNVWVSIDGVDFYQQATVTQPGRFGVTTADFPAGSDPDTTDTLSVSLAASGGTLTTASEAAADAQTTLCAVGTEIIAFSEATLTGASAYNLTSYIRRGLEGTTIADQPSGSLFLRLDNAVVAIPYNAGQIGKTMYVKLQSFNLYGNAFEDLDLCETYEFTAEPNGSNVGDVSWSDVTGVPPLLTQYVSNGGVAQGTFNVGTMTAGQVNTALSNLNPLADVSTPNTPPAPTVTFTTALDANGNLVVTMKGTVAAATDANIAGYEFQLSVNGGAATNFYTTGTSFTWQVPAGVSYSLSVSEVKLSGVQGAFSPAATGTTALNTAAPSAPSGLTATGGYGSNFLSWTDPSNTDLARVEIWGGTTNSQSASSLLGTVNAAPGLTASFSHGPLTTGATWYYWVRAVNTSGNKSAFTGSASAAPVGFPSASLVGGITSSQISSVAAASITGSLAATQIGAVNASVISGILAAANVPALSALSGQVTAAQISAVNAGSITGTITASQIASVSASSILSGALGSGVTIPAAGINGTLTAAQIGAVNASVVSGILSTVNIPGLPASQIISGQFGSSQLGPASVLASKLASGASGNMVADPAFSDPGYWGLNSTVSFVTSGSTAFTNLGVPTAMQFNSVGASASTGYDGGNQLVNGSPAIVVEPGKYYRMAGRFSNTSAFNGITYVYINWLTAAAGYISTSIFYGADHRGGSAGAVTADTLDTLVQAPTNAYGAQFGAAVLWGSSTPAGVSYFATPVMNRGIDTAFIVAGSIVAAQIAAGTIVASNIASGTITGSLIAAGTISASNIVAGTITSSQIAAATITAANIASGTITGNLIAANTITASQLAIGTFSDNLLLNGGFAAGPFTTPNSISGWTDLSSTGSYINATAGPSGGPAIVLNRGVGSGVASNAFQLVAGATYLITGQYAATATQSGGIYYRITYATAPPSQACVVSSNYTDIVSNVGVAAANTFYPVSYVFTVPAGYNYGSIYLYNTNTSGSGVAIFANLTVQKQLAGGNLIAGTITASQIAANTIIAANIAAGTITSTQIAANTITGGNILAGTITGSLIAAGTITASNILAGTITGTLIAGNTITGGNIAAGTITASNIQAGTITGSQIAASTITAGNLSVSTLSAITANLGTITAGYLQNSGGTTFLDLNNSRQQFTVGGYAMRMGSIGSGVLMWYGPASVALGSETLTNGVWAFSTAGTVYYGSSTLASQSTGSTSGSGSCGAPYGSGFGTGLTASFSKAVPSGSIVTMSANLIQPGTTNPYGSGTAAQTGNWELVATQGGSSTVLASGTWTGGAFVTGEGASVTMNNSSGLTANYPYSGTGCGVNLNLNSNNTGGASWNAYFSAAWTAPG